MVQGCNTENMLLFAGLATGLFSGSACEKLCKHHICFSGGKISCDQLGENGRNSTAPSLRVAAVVWVSQLYMF